MCDGKGDWVFYTCPIRLVRDAGEWINTYLREFARYRRGILPMSAGFHEHPAPFCQAMDILDSVHAWIEREEHEKARAEIERVRRR
jgi:hypothetical protein